MRAPVDEARLRTFLRRLGEASDRAGRVYLTGGSTAVLHGWRTSTLDVDLKLVPESDALFRAIPALKEELQLNVELAAPSDFVPPLPGWEERSRFVTRAGSLAVYEYDFYSQALAKLQRGHAKDLQDVSRMRRDGLIEPAQLRELFAAIEPELFRYPAIDPGQFRRAVERFLASE